MYLNAEQITIEEDENGFTLNVWSAEEDMISINVQAVAEELYDRVKGRIGPWLRERDETKRAYLAHVGAFHCDPDESAGAYELSDPKRPDFHSVHADIWDMRADK